MPDIRIIKVQAIFYTQTDDKDEGDGIAETYYLGDKKLCGNTGWGKDLTFHDAEPNYGQKFDIDVPAEKCSQLRYNMIMENRDGWFVNVHVYAWYSNGRSHKVGEATFRFGGNHREDNVFFLTCP